MKLFGMVTISFVSLFWGIEGTKVVNFPVFRYLRNELTSSSWPYFFAHSLKADLARAESFSVRLVLASCGLSQIFPFIVQLVKVNVVYLFFWPQPGDVKPNNPMNIKHVIAYSYAPVSFVGDVSGNVANPNSGSKNWWYLGPSQFSVLWKIGKGLARFFCRKRDGISDSCIGFAAFVRAELPMMRSNQT